MQERKWIEQIMTENGLSPPEETPPPFPLVHWLSEHYPTSVPSLCSSGCLWSVPCPFEPGHDASLLQFEDGGVVFKCWHHRCSEWDWMDFLCAHGGDMAWAVAEKRHRYG